MPRQVTCHGRQATGGDRTGMEREEQLSFWGGSGTGRRQNGGGRGWLLEALA